MAEVLRLPVAQVDDSLVFEAIEGWDSLRHIELVAGLERTFGIELTFDQIVATRAIGDARRLVEGDGESAV